MCIFCDTLLTNIKHGFEMEIARIKHQYETTGTPLNYAEYYPSMVESLDRRVEDKIQSIAAELARGAYNNTSSGNGMTSCC